MKTLLEEQLYKGTGNEFFVNSALTSVFSACKLEMKLENNAEVSVNYAQFPNSLLSKLKMSSGYSRWPTRSFSMTRQKQT